MHAQHTCGDSLWSVAFVKLCHVLCNLSAIVIFAAWLQALLDWGLYIKDGPWKDYSRSLHFWRKYFAAMSYMSSKVNTFDIFQCLVLQMHWKCKKAKYKCDVIGHRCYLIKCPSWTEQMYYFQKDTKYQTNSVFTKFHLTNFKGCCADRCSSFDISLLHKCLYHARLYHKARSDSREN